MTAVIQRRSARIHAVKTEEWYNIITIIHHEIDNINYYSSPENKTKLRLCRDHICILYKILADNYNILIDTAFKTQSAEQMFKMAFSRIHDFTCILTRNRSYNSHIISAFTVFTKKYRKYNKTKIHKMVLISKSFPSDIIFYISEYYLSPSNFIV